MSIAILGGGITGLTAAYDLSKQGYKITIFEKASSLGGLAGGFTKPGWEWSLERAYHHLFTNDYNMLSFAKEIGFDRMFTATPQTVSLFEQSNNTFVLYPFDSPLHILSFPLLSLSDRLRTSAILGFLKFSPHLSMYERVTAETFLRTTMGDKVWVVLWEQLFRKKFGKYTGNILSSFFWSRIKKRTKKLIYISGGFQAFIDHLVEQLQKNNVDIRLNTGVEKITKYKGVFKIQNKVYDYAISTLPTPVLARIGEQVFPPLYLKQLASLRYLHAATLIIESNEPFLDTAYWINVIPETIPITVIIQHTNLTGKKYYGNKHLLYIGNYVDESSSLLKMNKESAFKFFLPYLRRVTGQNPHVTDYWYFKGQYAQPVFDKEFLENKPEFITPVKNFFTANLDMTYPHDRGTNYAVKLGKEVSNCITSRIKTRNF